MTIMNLPIVFRVNHMTYTFLTSENGNEFFVLGQVIIPSFSLDISFSAWDTVNTIPSNYLNTVTRYRTHTHTHV